MTTIHHIGHVKGDGCASHDHEAAPQNTVAQWQDEHRKNLAAKGIEVPEEDRGIPSTFHCRRCHSNLPMPTYAKHYKLCPGFTSKCYASCPPTPPERVERTVPPYEP